MSDIITRDAPNWLNKIQVADANYTVTGRNGRFVAFTSLSAPRVVNLPAATTSGQLVQVCDESGSCNETNYITVTPNGSDAIENGVTKILNYPYVAATFESNGSGKWVIVTNPNPNLSAGVQVQPSVTDLGTGSVTIGNGGLYNLYTNASGIGKIRTFAINGNTFALTDLVNNYIVANYNSATPVIQAITDVTLINETTIIPILTIYRRGTALHIFNWDQLGDALVNKIHKSIIKTQRYRRESGLGLSEAGARNVVVGSGTIWTGAVPTVLPAFNSSTDQLIFAYHVAGAWTLSTVTQYNNTQYDDGTNLQALPGGKYAVNFVYRSVADETECIIVLGTAAYGLGDAQASQPPSNLPPIITSHAVLVGRIIVSQGGATATQIDSAFVTAFTGGGVTDHNSLTGLQGGAAAQYYHMSSAEYTGTGNGNFVRQNSPALTGIPTAPTALAADNSTTIATTAFVKSQGYAAGPNWGVQKAVVDVAENMLVDVNYQHHILKAFTVYGTMTVNGESYVFDGVN